MKKLFLLIFKNLISTLDIVPKKIRTKFFFLIFLSIIVVLSELISFSIFIPLFNQIFNGEMDKLSFLQDFFSYFDTDKNSITEIILIAIVIVFIFKALLIIFINKFKISFEADLENYVSNKLVDNFINQDLESYKKYEKSKINNELILDIIRYISFVDAIIVFFTEILVMIFIIFILMTVDFYSTFTIVSFMLILSVIYMLTTKKTFKIIGENAQKFENKYIHSVMEIYNLYKEIKIFDLHKKFSERTSIALENKIKNQKNYKFFILLPRIFFELATIVILSITFFILFQNKETTGEIFVILGLLSLAAIRVMPSIVKSINCINTIKYCDASVNTINQKLFKLKKNKESFIEDYSSKDYFEFKKSIELKNLNFKYKDSKIKILKNINIIINRGDYIGIVGPSGSGKSTLLDIIMLLQKDFEGTYLFDGQDVSKNNFFSNKKFSINFGYVSQNVQLINDTIKNNILLASKNLYEDLNLLNKTANITQLKNFISEQQNNLDTVIIDNSLNISGGQKQRLGIARAIYAKCPILILDEITSSLDTINQEKIMKEISLLKKEGKTIIQTTHNPEHYKYFDKVIDLKD